MGAPGNNPFLYLGHILLCKAFTPLSQILLKEIEVLKKEMAEMKRFKVKLPIIKSEERKLS